MSTASRTTTPRVAAYCRVSTHEQHADIQVEAIRKAAHERGWKLVAEHIDAGVSGGRDRRPAQRQLLLLTTTTIPPHGL
jgi:DNA invertase Pin-like site-specific DNA recombinase